MWARLAIAIALPLAPAACARPTAETRAPHLAAFIGADAAAVIRAYGPPDLDYATGSVRTLVYERQVVAGPSGGPHPRFVSFPCRLSFTLAEGRVRSFDQRGAGC
jgi:hypothetical protein